jgi:hypothetical protein
MNKLQCQLQAKIHKYATSQFKLMLISYEFLRKLLDQIQPAKDKVQQQTTANTVLKFI